MIIIIIDEIKLVLNVLLPIHDKVKLNAKLNSKKGKTKTICTFYGFRAKADDVSCYFSCLM